jgi:hypothetical protein
MLSRQLFMPGAGLGAFAAEPDLAEAEEVKAMEEAEEAEGAETALLAGALVAGRPAAGLSCPA